ncbi:hypothetical protein RLM94_01050, partial [Streptococcus pneumoniae]|nr:hypothetical protein [Streptococcus pneumoniae]
TKKLHNLPRQSLIVKPTLIKNQPLKRPLFYTLFYTMKGVMSIFSMFRPCPEADKQGEYNEI